MKNYNSVMAAVDDVSDTTVNNRTESLGNTTIANSKQLAKIGITMKMTVPYPWIRMLL